MAGRLSAAQIAYRRRIATTILDGICDLYRNPNLSGDDPVSGSLGQLLQPASTASWTRTAHNVACGFYHPSENPAGLVDSQIGQVATWLLSLPDGTDCQVGDRVIDTADSAEYQVHAPVNPTTYSTLAQFIVGKVE